jgi:hypothetical protein
VLAAAPAAAAAAVPQAAGGRMTHSDKVGEAVCMEEARYIINTVFDVIQGQVRTGLIKSPRCSIKPRLMSRRYSIKTMFDVTFKARCA